jgi:hypothetical protein
MKHEPISPPPPDSESPAGTGPRWTPRKMAEFLRALAATHSVKAAAKSVGMSRQSAYRLRSRLKGKAFDTAWDEAFHHSYRNLPYAALERALNGVEVPHYFRGELIGTSRRYDERLTISLLKLCTSSGALVVGGDDAVELQGRRFETLLAAIEAEGEAARDTAPACSRADPVDVSPPADEELMAQFRSFRRKPRG